MQDRFRSICFFLLIAPLGISAQDLDSLARVWHDTLNPLNDRLEALSEVCWALKDQDVDSAITLSKVLIELARSEGSAEDEGDAWNTMGNALLNAGRHKEALSALQRADNLYSRSNGKRSEKVLNNMALVYQGLGDHAMAIDLLLRAIEISERNKDTTALIDAYGNLGITYAMRKDNIRAARSLETAVGWIRKQNDPDLLALTLGNLGAVLSEMGKLEEARIYLEESWEYYRRLGSLDPGYAHACINLGVVYQRMGKMERSGWLFKEGLEAHERVGHRSDVANALINMGGNSILLKRYSEALAYCAKSLKIADELTSLFEQQYACECLYQAHEALGNYREALEYHKRMIAARDTLVNEENIQRITSMEMQFAFDKEQLADSLVHASAIAQLEDERTIEQLRADKNRNRAFASGGGGIILLLGSLAWYRVDRKRRQERFEKEAATLETQALRSQMNPHFIFNALNSINAYVQQNDQDSASNFLTKFARVMRGVLENSRYSEVPLKDDLDTLRGYLELERKRSQEKFDFSITVDPSIDPELVLVPPLVVQPFVENAIWHGMAGKQDKGHINLTVTREGKQLRWIIEDDGAGRNAGRAEGSKFAHATTAGKKTSLGTAITRSRLDLVQKQHGGNAGFRYIDLHQGTRVEVDMPLIA